MPLRAVQELYHPMDFLFFFLNLCFTESLIATCWECEGAAVFLTVNLGAAAAAGESEFTAAPAGFPGSISYLFFF